jgi:hypothetical protein
MAAPSAYIKSIEKLQLELILADTSDSYSTDTAIDYSERLIDFNFNPSNLEFRVEADGKIQAYFTGTSEATITMTITGITPAEEAVLLGQSNVGNLYGFGDGTDIPYFMLKFQAVRTDGSYEWYEFMKVKFKERARGFMTQKSDSLEVQYITLEGLAIARVYEHSSDTGVDNLGYRTIDTTIGATWFTEGDNISTPDTDAPEVDSVTPADDATDQLATVNVVWVFDKAMNSATLTSDNLYIFKESDLSSVAGAYTISTDTYANDTVTFNPTASLTAAEKYIAVVGTGVKSINCINIAAKSITEFTIAA